MRLGIVIRILIVLLSMFMLGCEEGMVRDDSSPSTGGGRSRVESKGTAPKKTVQSEEFDLAPRPQKSKR